MSKRQKLCLHTRDAPHGPVSHWAGVSGGGSTPLGDALLAPGWARWLGSSRVLPAYKRGEGRCAALPGRSYLKFLTVDKCHCPLRRGTLVPDPPSKTARVREAFRPAAVQAVPESAQPMRSPNRSCSRDISEAGGPGEPTAFPEGPRAGRHVTRKRVRN